MTPKKRKQRKRSIARVIGMKLEFYDWLRANFKTLEEAKRFARKFMAVLEQETPYGLYSMRAMTYHISKVLENKLPDCTLLETTHLETKYGMEIYHAMNGWIY